MILVIDDDRDFVASVRALLETEGYEVKTAPSCMEGPALIESADPDLEVAGKTARRIRV